MAEVHPIRGLHYNQALLNHWADDGCPVYDIISPQQQEELYLRSEYNFVRLEYGRELPQDTTTDNRYTRARTTLERWLEKSVLVADKTPAIYLYDQYFTHRGREYKRRGLIARVRLEEWDKMVIRPHEGTMAEPRADRLNLLRALQANTSSILALFEDRGRHIASLLAAQEQGEPLLNLRKIDGEGHRVWAITDPEVIGQIQSYLAEESLYVADGHHRYESALAYQRQQVVSSSSSLGEAGFNFVMMTLVDFTDPGLLVLPPHRLVRGIAKPALRELMPNLKIFFDIEELPLNVSAVWEQVDSRFNEANGVRLIVGGLGVGRLFLLSLRDPAAISPMVPYFHSDLYKNLDVSVLDHVILEKFLGLSGDAQSQLLGYSYDREDAMNRVLAQEYQLAFLLKPIKIETIKAIADIRERMPRKSTHFYPKLPAGLVINRLI